MWLSERAAASGRRNDKGCQTGTVTIGGEKCAVLISGEKRGLAAAAPGGIVWTPEKGQQVVTVTDGEGGEIVIGALDAAHSGEVGCGELLLYSKDASLHLKSNGEINVCGDLHISGNVYVTGSLYINGVDIMSAVTA